MANKRKGIDISYHQGNVDFEKVAKYGIKFVILREGYRTTIDKKFLEYVEQAQLAGIKVDGVYHFSYALNAEEAKQEAKSCVNNVIKAGLKRDDIIIFYDFEYDTVKDAAKKGVTLTKSACNEHTKAFCETVESMGYKAGIYLNKDYYKNWYDKGLLNKYLIWLADYVGDPDYPCAYQQTSSTGKVSGINGNVDMDVCFISAANKNESTTTDSLKDIKAVAQEVIDGKWGNGADRKNRLTEAGYDYAAVQSVVNDMIEKNTAVITKYKAIGDYYVRSGPGKTFDTIGIIKKNEIIESDNDPADNKNWIKFNYKGQIAYTSAEGYKMI